MDEHFSGGCSMNELDNTPLDPKKLSRKPKLSPGQADQLGHNIISPESVSPNDEGTSPSISTGQNGTAELTEPDYSQAVSEVPDIFSTQSQMPTLAPQGSK